MTDQTFGIRDFADSCGSCFSAAADAAFPIPACAPWATTS